MWSDTEPDDEAAAAFFRPRSDEARAAVACPPPELVQAWRMGALPPRLQQRVAAHVEHCVVCQALGEALDDSSVGSLTPEEQERILERVHIELGRSARTFFPGRLWQWSAVAAGVALLGAGSLLVRRSRSVPAPSVFQLEKPAIRAPAATDLLWRGAADSGDDLARALEFYRADDFAEAARRLKVLVSSHPESAAGHFYLGVSELFLHRDADAVTTLQAAERLAKDDADLAREAAWYLAFAYRRAGRTERAAAKLDALCRGRSSRAVQACAGLRELSTSSSSPPGAR
jgi:tetratricopeptide (TPR) repeat protein